MSAMKYLVTGGDGFIGRALVRRLLEDGHGVVIVDNHITSEPGQRHSRLDRVVQNIEFFDTTFIQGRLDGIIHLASVAIPTLYMERPRTVIDPNVWGTQRMCDLAKEKKCRLLFTSSSEVYGHTTSEKCAGAGISELDRSLTSLLTPRTPYSSAKRMGEELVSSFRRDGGDGAALRLFNVYGPGMDRSTCGYGRVIPNFVDALSSGRDLPIYGDGEQTRCFLWIDDAVEVICHLLHYPEELPQAINIGHPDELTVNKLAKMILLEWGSDVGMEHLDTLPDEPRHRRPDTTLLRELTGWEPIVDLAEGLRRIHASLDG